MGDVNYEKLLDRISKASGLAKDEIERKIEAKIAKLAGLISKEGAAQVVSAELGISFDNEKFKIEEIVPGMRKVNVVGKVINIFPVRSFEKQGKVSKVANFIIADDSSNVKVVLWDTHHIDLIENKSVSEGTVVEIIGASSRDNEIHLGSFSEMKISNQILDNVKTGKIIKEKPISEFKTMDNVSVRAFIVQTFEPKFFYVCPECKKKVNQDVTGFSCSQHGKTDPERRALINIVIDDGTETIRSVLFNDQLREAGINELNDPERLSMQRQALLGKEMIFSGTVKINKFFNNPEFVIDSAIPVELDILLAQLEK